MSAGVERLFSQFKIMLTDRQIRLQIDSLQAVECIKLWDALQIGLPQVVVTGPQLEDVGKAELDIDQAEDQDIDIMKMLRMQILMWKSSSLDWSRPSPSSPRLPVCSPVQSDPHVGLDRTEPYPRPGSFGLMESLMVLKHRRLLPTAEDAMHHLLEEETIAGLTNELGDTCTGAALLTQYGNYHGRGQHQGRGRGGSGGSGGSRNNHEQNGNALRREITPEKRTNVFATSPGFPATSKSIVSPTNV
ncbi:hypothetical protein BDD12DRAFT_876683 [Trichophaea hybrida]|nr:hypothetical protein BDD12DRAFT_876683 [Trichophaea hybrida]